MLDQLNGPIMPCGIRTHDFLIRSQALYPAELRALCCCYFFLFPFSFFFQTCFEKNRKKKKNMADFKKFLVFDSKTNTKIFFWFSFPSFSFIYYPNIFEKYNIWNSIFDYLSFDIFLKIFHARLHKIKFIQIFNNNNQIEKTYIMDIFGNGDSSTLLEVVLAFKKNYEAFLSSRSLDLDGFVQQSVVFLVSETRDEFAKIQLLLLWQENIQLLFQENKRFFSFFFFFFFNKKDLNDWFYWLIFCWFRVEQIYGALIGITLKETSISFQNLTAQVFNLIESFFDFQKLKIIKKKLDLNNNNINIFNWGCNYNTSKNIYFICKQIITNCQAS